MDDAQRMKMQYLGTLNLLTESSILMGNGGEAGETRKMIERAVEDAQNLTPNLPWRRVLQCLDIWIANSQED